MRFHLLFALPLAALTLAPAAARDRTANPDEIARVAVLHLDARDFFDALRALPDGIRGVYAMPRGDALIVRGSAAAIGEMESAMKVVDVAPQNGRLALTLRHADPEAIRSAALALPRSGMAEIQARIVQFEGQPDWLRQVQGLVFGAELTHPVPVSLRREGRRAPRLP